MRRPAGLCGIVLAFVIISGLLGCASVAELLAYTGGGLPPGEPDLGGVVVAEAPEGAAAGASVQTAQTPPPGTVPVVGAQVVLMRGNTVVGRATTGDGGYFRFENPDTGSYRLLVIPPGGSGLRDAERTVSHQRGQMSFVTVILEREAAPGPGPGGPN